MVNTNPLDQTIHQVAERSFLPLVLALSCPAWVSIHPRKRGLIALLAYASGPTSKRIQNAMEVVVGDIVVLRLCVIAYIIRFTDVSESSDLTSLMTLNGNSCQS